MRILTGVTLAAIFAAAASTAAVAKPTSHAPAAAARQNPVASVRAPLQLQTGPKTSTSSQGFKPLQLQVTPHKPEGSASPAPIPTPEFNPLKRRRMAMPGIPEPDLAF
jgi:hypothetical protein